MVIYLVVELLLLLLVGMAVVVVVVVVVVVNYLLDGVLQLFINPIKIIIE